jgi:G6PDH family F420-dependent oxidoreductase
LVKLGYFLSSEEFAPGELVRQAGLAEEAGFHALWISDHFHPWNDEQGHSGFVWSTIAAISQVTNLRATTAVTCPTIRTHPAIVAHAAATCAVLLDGRFQLGVGSGEALNEHVHGDRWPEADERLEMLEEAVEVIRLLWSGGSQSHRGRHYRVENARIYDLPDQPPEILVSGFGPKACELAGRIGDGFATVMPDESLVAKFREGGGEGKPMAGGTKVCWGEDEKAAVKTAHRLWANEQLPGELNQILPTPSHFEQANTLVSEEMVAEVIPCGPDLDKHVESFQEFADLGFDELFVGQIGPDQDKFFEIYGRDVVPRFNGG